MNSEKTKPAILIVDDDKNTRDGLRRVLSADYSVFLAESGEKALEILSQNQISVLVTDVRMPGIDGITLMKRALAQNPRLECILLTAYGTVEMAVEAMNQGAFYFLTKPVNLDQLEALLRRAARSAEMEAENIKLRQELDDRYGLENIIGNSPPMMQLFNIIRQASPTQATILIQGESGTGKELVAHAIHRLSARSRGPFVAVHCAALSATLLESELFGHEKGAFTGATHQRQGRFEMADGGTLFLDEISEIDPSIQVKLLRVLEERKFERVGGNELVEVDIRLIAATNRDLRRFVEEGKFREDLFFRLDVVNINLPPLRERVDDIPLLCGHFLKEFNQKHGKNVEGLTPDAIAILSSYHWPGNVRELRNTMEKMVVMAHGNRLSARDIPHAIREQARGGQPVPGAPAAGGAPAHESLADMERKMIIHALKRQDNNITKAAQELGISRRTLHRKLKKYRESGLLGEKADHTAESDRS